MSSLFIVVRAIRTACIYLAYASVQPQFKGVAVDRVTALLLHLRKTLLTDGEFNSIAKLTQADS
jgi:hypothetical protein